MQMKKPPVGIVDVRDGNGRPVLHVAVRSNDCNFEASKDLTQLWCLSVESVGTALFGPMILKSFGALL